MFTKVQFFIGIAVSAFIGIGVGYSKSREKCLEAMIKAMPAEKNEDKQDQTDE